MALLQLPNNIKFQEFRMMVATDAASDAMSTLTLRSKYGAAHREVWKIEATVSPLRAADMLAFETLLERLDGRVNSLRVAMPAGVATQAATATVALAAASVRGADTLDLEVTTAPITAGTLIGVGDITTAAYQVFEVLEDVATQASGAVKVAPRVRYEFADTEPVTVGANVEGRFNLANDSEGAPEYRVSGAGFLNLSLVEVP